VEQGRIVERGNHAELFAMGGRYYDLYTRQHGLEANLFLAPGEGDVTPAQAGDPAQTRPQKLGDDARGRQIDCLSPVPKGERPFDKLRAGTGAPST
jgi:hypothetical protein